MNIELDIFENRLFKIWLK